MQFNVTWKNVFVLVLLCHLLIRSTFCGGLVILQLINL